MIHNAGISMMLCCHIRSSSTLLGFVNAFACLQRCRARRTERGDLVPDASDDVVRKSQGFDKYEHAPRVEAKAAVQDKRLV